MRSSQFIRPAAPSRPIIFNARDREILRAIRNYRLLYSRHLQILAFPTSSLRIVQKRLRLLWEHRIIERYFRPVLMTGERPVRITAAYGLGPNSRTIDVDGELLGTPKEPSLVTFDHEIAAADVLTAAVAACRGRPDVTLVDATPQGPLWRIAKAAPATPPFLVPDGVIRLRYADGTVLTFYVEIVRADVRGGNDSIRKKMENYSVLNREGRFRTLYGHEQLRAVLFLTTSDERAEHFRQLAAALPYGRRLFWFGAYQTLDADGRELPAVTPENVFDRRWTTAEGETLSLLAP